MIIELSNRLQQVCYVGVIFIDINAQSELSTTKWRGFAAPYLVRIAKEFADCSSNYMCDGFISKDIGKERKNSTYSDSKRKLHILGVEERAPIQRARR